MKMKTMYAAIAVLAVLIVLGTVLLAVMLLKKDGKPSVNTTYKNPLTEKYSEYVYSDSDETYLMIVSRDRPIGRFVPRDLIRTGDITDYKLRDYPIEKRTAMALTAMLLEAEADGVKGIRVTSAYRSYDYQENLFDSYCVKEMNSDKSLTREEAEAIVKKYSNPPGCSEHQTGLCVDLFKEGDEASLLEESFADTDAGKWLAANCHRFGFVLRYPKGKYEITGIEYEPWHFRYVGKKHAEKMNQLGMCLEEYAEYLTK